MANQGRRGTEEISSGEISSAVPPPPPPCSLPDEVIFDILSRLPVKSLLRFKSVSKPWLSLISSPNFVKAHLLHGKKFNPSPSSSLMVFSRTHILSSDISISLVKNSNNLIRLEPPVTNNLVDLVALEVVGCCDGIVCFSLHESVHFWNPATEQAKHFLLASPAHYSEVISGHSLGFGFDPISGDYKLVRALTRSRCVFRWLVYSANAEASREFLAEEMNIGKIRRLSDTCDACVKGVLYWKTDDELQVVSFDLHREVFVRIPMPSSKNVDVKTCRFVEFRDSAAMIGYSGDKASVCLWTVDDGLIDGKISWTKMFTFDAVPVKFLLHWYLGTGEIVASDEAGLLLYDPGNKESKYPGLSERVLKACEYTESLVSLKGFIKAEEDVIKKEGEVVRDNRAMANKSFKVDRKALAAAAQSALTSTLRLVAERPSEKESSGATKATAILPRRILPRGRQMKLLRLCHQQKPPLITHHLWLREEEIHLFHNPPRFG